MKTSFLLMRGTDPMSSTLECSDDVKLRISKKGHWNGVGSVVCYSEFLRGTRVKLCPGQSARVTIETLK